MYMGTYNTILEYCDDHIIEEYGEEIIDKIDYESFYRDQAKEIFDLSVKYLKENWIIAKLWIIEMKWVWYFTPKCYNYTTDKINVDYELKEDLEEWVWIDELIDIELEKIWFNFIDDIYYDITTDIFNYITN